VLLKEGMMIMKTINNSDLKMIIEEVLHDIMNENAKILPQFEDAGKYDLWV